MKNSNKSAQRVSPAQLSGSKVSKWYKSTWFIVLLLILVPPLGLLWMWILAPWKIYIKTLVTVPVIFTSAVLLVTLAGVIQSGVIHGTVLREEQARMESFLGKKYGKKFAIKDGKISNDGDLLLGFKFKTYRASVSPTDNPSVSFTASRVIEGQALNAGEDSPDKMNYSDDYVLRLWTRELQDKVIKVVMDQPIDAFDVAFRVGLAKNRATVAEFYDKIWGTVPNYEQLPLELKQHLSMSVDIKAVGPVDANKVEAFAGAMIAARDSLDPNKQGLDVQITTFEVYRNEKDSKPGWEWQNVGHVKLREVESIDELTPYFVKWTDGTGQYYNPKTRAFDLNNPK